MARPNPLKILPTLLLGSLIMLPTAPASAARVSEPTDEWCGTDDTVLEQSLARQRQTDRLAKRTRREARRQGTWSKSAELSGSATEVRKEGNVAVAIDNDGRMVRERNNVDFPEDFAIQFKYKKRQGGYQTKEAGGFNPTIGDRLELTDDDSVAIELPFKVKFFGKRYDRIFVNSDGNVTFDEADFASTSRDVSRFLSGPPRVAAFFSDLNPETAPADGGVFALIGAKSVRLTWVKVPEFSEDNAGGNPNTFQLTLAKNGKVSFAFGELNSTEGIVGISPGGGATLNFFDFSTELPAATVPGAIAESFSSSLSIDETAIAQVFFENFADRYKTLVVFTDFSFFLLGSPGTVAYEQTTKNDISGIGLSRFDVSRFYGSGGNFESFVMMGDVAKYGSDIESTNQLGGVYSPLDILMHEIGHRWGVFLAFDGGDQLLGRGGAHWSYCFNSKDSYLEGNPWRDNGDGSFSIVRGAAEYNDFDLYSMGLLAPADVESSFVVDGQCLATQAPRVEGGANGTAVDVSIQDVIDANGARDPSFQQAPKTFEMAFLLIVKAGEEPRPGSVGLVNAYRRGSEEQMKEQGGTIKTKLR